MIKRIKPTPKKIKVTRDEYHLIDKNCAGIMRVYGILKKKMEDQGVDQFEVQPRFRNFMADLQIIENLRPMLTEWLEVQDV